MTSIHGWPIYQRLQEQLPGHRLHAVCPPKTRLTSTAGVSSLTITDETSLEHIRDTLKPTHIVHCAGVCDLNVCEARPAWAHDLNVNGAKIVRRVFGDRPILYVSTDLVFSGDSPPLIDGNAVAFGFVAGNVFFDEVFFGDALPSPIASGGSSFAAQWIPLRSSC